MAEVWNPRLARRPPVAAAIHRRLIGNARVEAAIGRTLNRLAAAEEELRRARIADGPTALVFAEFQQRAALPDWNDVLDDFRLGLDLQIVLVGERGVAAHLGPDPHHVGVGARLALARRRGRRRLGAARQAQAMDLA